MLGSWLIGLVRTRGVQLAAASAGVGLAVCLLVLLGSFVVESAATMTSRATAQVAPDWQVQLVGTTDASGASEAISSTVATTALEQVDFADVASLTSSSGGTVQTTGAGKVVGLAPTFIQRFPHQIRLLDGSLTGVLLAQQTAANLHAGPGDKVSIERLGQPPAEVRIDGVIDMPNADQFFQTIQSASQTAPTAPPDNVVLLPEPLWEELFGSQLESMPQTAQRQLHASFDHGLLPDDPSEAYVMAASLANNLAAKLAGEGAIANNLAARLDGVREDSLFAKVLFLFLGAPGAAIAVLLTMLIAASGADRRRHDTALLQIRGAGIVHILALGSVEALTVGMTGAACGIFAAVLLEPAVTGGDVAAHVWWRAGAALGGIGAALMVFLIPAWRAVHRTAAQNSAETLVAAEPSPGWRKLGADVILLGVAAFVFWQVAATGYQVVVAPEGVATATVDFKAYVAPAFFWAGSGLLLARLFSMFMARGERILAMILRPAAGTLATAAAASVSHDARRITQGVVLVALAVSFAVSTAIFNTTYEHQAAIDANLTNGADVTVMGTAASPASLRLDELRSIKGVAWAEPMQHRFAYVGNDLQDLYGIDPASIGQATAISNAYFAGGDAASALELLKRTPNGVLVSDETVSDFQLKEGDTLNLRLQSGASHAYQPVPFTFIGVVREFPTAPSDSFLVANSAYIATQTGIPGSETVLIKSAIEPSDLANTIRRSLAEKSGLSVSTTSDVARLIGSSLVSVDLRGLTGLELLFALPLVAGAMGLVFALGLVERRRTFAILSAIGATPSQLGAFLWNEALIVYVAGSTAGLAIGWMLAFMLVKLMTQVFDPPPESLYVPWAYIGLLALAGLVAIIISVVIQLRKPKEPLSAILREM